MSRSARSNPRAEDVRSAATALLEVADRIVDTRPMRQRRRARGVVETCVGYLRALADDIERQDD